MPMMIPSPLLRISAVIFDPDPRFEYPFPERYWQNGFNVTWYVFNKLPLPLSERFFEVTCK